jgi:hypothetical protein
LSGDLTTLLVAIVGVIGTLGGVLLTQNRADRTKRMELAQAAAQRLEERQHADLQRETERAEVREQEAAAARRACFISLNTAARQYLTALTNYMHALLRGGAVEASGDQLEARRLAYRDSYAAAQMIVPLEVLHAASTVNRKLDTAYGMLKRIETQTDERVELLQAMQDDLSEIWVCLRELRRQMRLDLGIDPISADE